MDLGSRVIGLFYQLRIPLEGSSISHGGKACQTNIYIYVRVCTVYILYLFIYKITPHPITVGSSRTTTKKTNSQKRTR